MLNSPFSPWPSYSEQEIGAVADVVRSNRVNYWTGEEGRHFEREFATWANSDYGIALANGTLALDLALRALRIGPGDEVIVTPRSFIASISTVVNAGAIPIFADVDRDSGNISPQTIAAVITDRTRAIIPVHLAGWPADMNGIIELAQPHGIKIIEDCAQAHGALIDGRSVGSMGDIGAWSFCQDKIMTTGGEGGMVTTSDKELWNAMWSFKDHGKSWKAVYERDHPPGFRWLHEGFGTNWRMLEVQASIGRYQLTQMADWTKRRTMIAMAMSDVMKRFPDAVRVPEPDTKYTHAYYRLYAYVKPEGLKPGWTRDCIVDAIMRRGVPAFQGSCSEVYLEKAFDGTGYRPTKPLPVAHELGQTSLMFLTHPTITDLEVQTACEAIFETFAVASRR